MTALRVTPTRRLLLQAAQDGRVVHLPAGVTLLVGEPGSRPRGVTGPAVVLRRAGLLTVTSEPHPSYRGRLLRPTAAAVALLDA